jgi:hypothetical protein
MNQSFEQFTFARSLIERGDRVTAARHLKAAIYFNDKAPEPDPELTRKLASLLAVVESA